MRLFCLLMLALSSCVAGLQLTISGKHAELKEAEVMARLHGNFLIRDLKLVFHNPGRRVAEGDLVCPLDEGEEVISFAMDVNGKRRDAVVVPQEQARHAYETIVARGDEQRLINEFNLKHGLMDERAAMVVLETPWQYVEFGITPPQSDEELYARWQDLRKRPKKNREYHLNRLAELWEKRCDILSKPVPMIETRLVRHAEARSKELTSLASLDEEKGSELVVPLQEKLAEVRALASDELDEVKVAAMKRLLEEVEALEEELRVKIPWIQVTVGGQVRRGGRLSLESGSTLLGAIQAAGGETPYGAMNRVKLYRQGKAYTYDMKIPEHQKVRLYSGDVVEVPEANLLGNGGSGKAGTAPFSDRSSSRIIFERGAEHPSKYYLDDLVKHLGDDLGWWERYRVFREACGWRADFYLNVIEFLRDRGEREKAMRVTADLAESMPGNTEILRRAALAYRRLGAKKTSYELFVRILELHPDSKVALGDLARAEEILGKDEMALMHYWQSVQVEDSFYTRGRALVFLEEMNALIARSGLKPNQFGIDPRFVRHIPVELRVVLRWDADQSNLDLTVRKPGGWMSLRGGPVGGEGLEWWSGNLSRGFGPESWCVQGLFPGSYEIGARFYGDWNRDGKSTATAELEVIRNFGAVDENRKTYALRIEEQTEKVMVKAKAYPPGWE